MRKWMAAGLAATALAVAHPTLADVVTYYFAGVWDGGNIDPIGSGFAGSISWDTAASVVDSFSDAGQDVAYKDYAAITGWTLTSGSFSVTGPYASPLRIGHETLFDFFLLNDFGPTVEWFQFGLADETGTLYGMATALPLTLDLADFGYTRVMWSSADLGFGNTGHVTAISTSPVAAPSGPIPEPATWALMIVGLGLAGVMARRQRVRGSSRPSPC